MKKYLIAAGLVGAFFIGSISTGAFFSYTNSNPMMNGMMNDRGPGMGMMNQQESGEMGPRGGMMGQNGMMNDRGPGMGMMNQQEPGEMGPRGMMGQNNMMANLGNMSEIMDSVFKEAAKTLGITTEELQNAMQSGKTINSIAEEKGIKLEELADNMKKVITEQINLLKKEGNLTAGEERMLTHMSENIDMMLNVKGNMPCMDKDEIYGKGVGL
jgi:uncharacterized protein YidB (DUF937 family)